MNIITSLLVLVACACCLVSAKPYNAPLQSRSGGTCSGGTWVTPVIIGNQNKGTAFCESNWGTTYTPITNLTVYGAEYYVNGIVATYSDGTQSSLIGVAADYKVGSIGVNYAFEEYFTKFVVYYENSNIVHLTIKTSTGQVLNIGEDEASIQYDGITGKDLDIGPGILFGIQGTYTKAFNSLGFIFLADDITNIAVTNLEFTNGPTGDEDLTPTLLDQANFYNNQPAAPYVWSFANDKALATSNSFSQTTTLTYANSVTFGISGAFPTIVTISGGGGFSWTTAFASATTTSVATSTTVTWGASGTLQPSTGVEVTSFAQSGSGTFAYTSTVVISLANGQTFSYTENGELGIQDVSSAYVTVAQDNNPGP